MTTVTPNVHAELPGNVRPDEEPQGGLAKLDISRLKITLTDVPKPLPTLESAFGVNFSDHMAITSFHPASGWSPPEIKPYGPLTVDPASPCFQYGCNVYEGMKAYLGSDGKARLFRPHMNMQRLERSMARLALPYVDGNAVLELIKHLIQTDKRWIPAVSGHSLYIRPTVIGTRPAIGVAASDHATLYILTCPCGPYFPSSISLLAVGDPVRAWPGGTGDHKVGGNYAPSFLPQSMAAAKGYDQVLWLFGEEQRVTEAGVMNVFVVIRRADGDGLDFITPPLDGLILPGVTRLSCLELASDLAFQASIPYSPSMDTISSETGGTKLHPAERTFTLSDLERWSASGDLLEFLCVGTAAIVTAAHQIGFDKRVVAKTPTYSSDSNGLGPVGSALRDKILAVQEGREEYRGWGVVCA